jgi:ribosomal protein S18 acetylase RimI-like enzyme
MGGLDSLLREETESWRTALRWDFRPSADLVRRYVNIRALDGYALFAGVEAAGYIYWVTEDRKALIGDLYVRAAYRSDVTENLLLEAALARLLSGPHFTSNWVRRVEGQMMQSSLRAAEAAPSGPRPRGFLRHFLLAPAGPLPAFPPRALPAELTLHGFSPRWIDEAARLIARVYATHIDSEINDQYRTVEGSRRFLQNVVQYPGCGAFHHASSYLLLDAQGAARALCIASMVSEEAGHIPQICVDPLYQHAGLGYELLRRSMLSLARGGVRDVSLTVTAANLPARQLYERMGYRLIREFEALIWEDLSG